jgi:hypothetical protein
MRTLPAAAPLLLALAAHAQTIISDTEFPTLLWSHSILWSRPSADLGPFSQQLAGGNPGAFQQGMHTTNGPFATIYDGHLFQASYYPNPQGAITTLDVSYDLINLTPGSIQSGLLAFQAGHSYIRDVDSNDHAAWTTVGVPGITGADNQWQEISVAGGLTPGHPDFTADGLPLTFGYYTFNWSLSVGFLIERTWGIDNFIVTIHNGTTPCYPNCDASTTAPVLNVADFSCFLNHFAAGDSYANCDGSTTAPVLNVADFSCFLNAFAAGCS